MGRKSHCTSTALPVGAFYWCSQPVRIRLAVYLYWQYRRAYWHRCSNINIYCTVVKTNVSITTNTYHSVRKCKESLGIDMKIRWSLLLRTEWYDAGCALQLLYMTAAKVMCQAHALIQSSVFGDASGFALLPFFVFAFANSNTAVATFAFAAMLRYTIRRNRA